MIQLNCKTGRAYRSFDWLTSSGILIEHNSFGHSSGNFKSGPFFHLSIVCWAGIPLDTSSATFFSPETCLHWSGSDLLWISAIQAETNGLNSLAWLWIHERTMWLLEKKI